MNPTHDNAEESTPRLSRPNAAHAHARACHKRVSDQAFELRRKPAPSLEELRAAASFASLDLLTVIEIAQAWSPVFAAMLARRLAVHLERRRKFDEAMVAKAERRRAS